MKAQRIGKTPRDELKWAIREAYKTEERTPGDWLNFMLEAALFAGVNPLSHYGSSTTDAQQYRDDTLARLRELLDKAVARDTITDLPRPYPPVLTWDKDKEEYTLEPPRQSEYFETRLGGRLGELILEYGRLIKTCQAPAKKKRGRKPKNAPTEPRGKCGNVFLAIKGTQLYCSPACLDRAVRKPKQPEQPKGRKRRRKK